MELPKPLYQIVVSYAFPYFDDENEISGYAEILKYFGLGTQVLDRLVKLKQKYPFTCIERQPDDTVGGRCLLDALSTGQMSAYTRTPLCTYTEYTLEIENDIKFLICNFPQSIYYPRGYLRVYWRVPPLAMACVNIRIPIYIVELLLQNGADPDSTFDSVGDKPVKIIDELRYAGVLKVRYEAIKALFLKYRKH